MRKITVKASVCYDVIIGSDILSQLGAFTSEIKHNCTAAIISDTNVWPIYGSAVYESLQKAEIKPIHFAFPAGEESKNIDTYFQILNFLAENKITRSDVIIALGGGVVGDISGFVAATYLRGIPYIQVPTSLLAMVDSSVGGKTAIDLPVGKNLVGAFKQPSFVLCDVSTLQTLPDTLFRDGCAEVIKYGVLYDASLIAYLQKTGMNFDREMVIAKCVSMKRDVVQTDEFDNGDRQKLNLGHTIGHGIEAKSNFQITHGQAVAVGMAIVARAAVTKGICSETDCKNLVTLLQQFSLPTETVFSASELYHFALSDKKRNGSMVNLVIPKQMGNCLIVPTPVSELELFIKAGLS